MHQISRELPEFDCWFSQAFTDSPFVNYFIEHTNLLDTTILSGQFRKNSEKYLLEHNLQIDYRALKNDDYALVVYCADMIVPKRMREFKTVWVQEGMTDRFNTMGKIVKALGLPTWLSGNTALNGSRDILDIYCASSQGYKRHFAKNGTRPDKIVVTGMPNYDNLAKFKKNDFPHHNYVMVATTDMRETIRYENRVAFIKEAVKIANGRQLLFKLHPNEKMDRAKKEIAKYAPAGTLVYDSGNTNEMIANCCELITQYSTVVYTGMALGKKVHSWFDVKELKKLTPIQNGGASARNIAAVCRRYALYTGPKGTYNVLVDNQPQRSEPVLQQLAVA
jgi:hypothetical protein